MVNRNQGIEELNRANVIFPPPERRKNEGEEGSSDTFSQTEDGCRQSKQT